MGEVLLQWDNKYLTQLKLRLLHFPLKVSGAWSQQTITEVTVLGGVTNPDYQEEIGLLLHNGGTKDYVWSIGDPLGHLLLVPCPVVKVSGKLQQPNPGRMTKGAFPSGMKVWVTPPGTEPPCLLRWRKHNWIVEESSDKHRPRSHIGVDRISIDLSVSVIFR